MSQTSTTSIKFKEEIIVHPDRNHCATVCSLHQFQGKKYTGKQGITLCNAEDIHL
jgi:hypothetical protein